MKVAVTYDEEEMIFQHFGHTERFKLYDIENGEIVSSEVVDTAGTGHEALAEFLAKRGVQTLICGGIGAGAVQALGAPAVSSVPIIFTGGKSALSARLREIHRLPLLR